MAQDSSFDIVSKLDHQEVRNAVDQARREIGQRYDFRGSDSEIELEEEALVVSTDVDFRIAQIRDVLESKLVRRNVDIKALDWGEPQPASGGRVRCEVKLKSGVPTETAREIVKLIKQSKIKVQVAIQGDQLRVTGKKRDDLQAVIQMVKDRGFDLPLQFVNYR